MCDTEVSHFAKDPVEQIANALEKSYPRRPEDHLDSEDFAYYTALEFLYPWPTRFKTTGDLGGLSHFKVADRLKIPERTIEHYLLSSYGKLSEFVNGQL